MVCLCTREVHLDLLMFTPTVVTILYGFYCQISLSRRVYNLPPNGRDHSHHSPWLRRTHFHHLVFLGETIPARSEYRGTTPSSSLPCEASRDALGIVLTMTLGRRRCSQCRRNWWWLENTFWDSTRFFLTHLCYATNLRCFSCENLSFSLLVVVKLYFPKQRGCLIPSLFVSRMVN